MASSDLKELGTYSSAIQAELVVGILRENGIPAVTNAGESNVALAQIQSGMGAIRVYVALDQLDNAKHLLEELADDSGEPWYCGKCKTDIDAGFDVCWSCGGLREEVQAPFPEGLEKVTEHESPLEPALPMFNGQVDTSNPYHAPAAPAKLDAEPSASEDQLQADELINRAWIASIFGLVFLPFAMQFYSMYLLIGAGLIDAPLSEQSQSKYNRTIILNIAGIIVMAFIARMIWSNL
jgi:hypothetical protein